MSASWIVSVGGRAYGPYTDAQMTAFVAEGRLTPQSLIARSGETAFRAAGEDPALAELFGMPQPSEPEPDYTPLSELQPAAVFGRTREEGPTDADPAHIIVIADMKSRSINGLEEEIYKLGQVHALLPQVWIVRTDHSVNAVRNVLIQQLGKIDVLFVVDATNDKAAWFNFGPEAESRIKRIWSRSPDRKTARPAESGSRA